MGGAHVLFAFELLNLFACSWFLRTLLVEQGLIVCWFCVCVSETISRPLIGPKLATLLGVIQHSYTRRTLRSMTSTKVTYLLQQENKMNKRRLSLAVPHSDLSTTLNIFISGVSSRIMIIEPNIKLNIEPEVLAFQQRYVRSWGSTSISSALCTFLGKY